jgi:hypothetical protein
LNSVLAAERAKRLIPHAEVTRLADEGHLFSVAGWQRVNDTLLAWQYKE